MAETNRCPKCGAELPADAPAGLCPECLFKQSLEAGDSRGGDSTAGYEAGFVAPQPAELARHFPQLEILAFIGKGGMGAVYKARQKQLDRIVALKILPPQAGRDPAFAERFGREARALAQLNHHNIVDVYDFGSADGLYYLTMEYVDGTNLRELIRSGGLAPEQALAIVPQVCEALQFAHDEGIVHRDIKPENILVNRRGQVKIADFGLAKLLGKSPESATLTGTQQVMGTLHYMAPEQMQGSHEVDHRADIYSLGVVFYEMLTGQLPIGRFEPPSRRVAVDVRLDEVVLRTLESDPQRRYQHASDVKTDVQMICELTPAARTRLYGHEYRSRANLFGWPLLHIAFGIDPATGRTRTAKGVIAIGDRAIGLLAIGGAALGMFAFGGVAVGLFALGGAALGVLAALGGLAVGGASFGGLAIGVIALGGGAVGLYAFGGEAWGLHLLSAKVKDPEAVRFFEPWAASWMDWLTILGMAIPAVIGLLWLLIWIIFWLHYRAAMRQQNAGGKTTQAALDPIREEIRRPAVGLLITGIADWIALPITLAVLLYTEMERGTVVDTGVVVAIGLGGLALSGAIIFGAIKMMRLDSYGAAVLASVLAMIVTPGNLVGLPIGIWAFVTLTSRDVRAAFARRALSQTPTRREPPASSESRESRQVVVPTDDEEAMRPRGKPIWRVLAVVAAMLGSFAVIKIFQPDVSDTIWSMVVLLTVLAFVVDLVRYRQQREGLRAVFILLAAGVGMLGYLAAQPATILDLIYELTGGEAGADDPVAARVVIGFVILVVVLQMFDVWKRFRAKDSSAAGR
jgi:tRNA A-37 threonylcarbamoyl transferase component Bud32